MIQSLINSLLYNVHLRSPAHHLWLFSPNSCDGHSGCRDHPWNRPSENDEHTILFALSLSCFLGVCVFELYGECMRGYYRMRYRGEEVCGWKIGRSGWSRKWDKREIVWVVCYSTWMGQCGVNDETCSMPIRTLKSASFMLNKKKKRSLANETATIAHNIWMDMRVLWMTSENKV